jgi:hypothetical protein
MDHQAWQVKNRAAIMERLQGLRDKPDGIIYFEPAGSLSPKMVLVFVWGSWNRAIPAQK